MPRKTQTEEQWRAKVNAQHLPAMEAALRSLRRSTDADESREASRVLEAGGCYIRRGLEKGWTL